MRSAACRALLLVVIAAGCATSPKEAPVRGGMIQAMREGDLDKAARVYAAGQYPQAVIEYRKVLDDPKAEGLHQQARIGLVRTCLRMGQPSAAIAQIQLAPDAPGSRENSELFALMGEALLRDARPQEAEVLLRRALESPTDDAAPARWRPACQANYACVLLKNGKPARAAEVYRQAAARYQALGEQRQARRAIVMAERLDSILRKNRPAKPAIN